MININVVEFANNKYYEVNYKGLEIVIAYSKLGKSICKFNSFNNDRKFGWILFIISGVAGGINPNLKIGDLIHC